MTHTDLLDELKKLTAAEQLKIAEAALRLVREELQQAAPASEERTRLLKAAAEALRADYAAGGELTAFTALDGEDIRASG
jgi:ABC-type uncharacterized transport system auxiliary subunit